MKIQHSKSDHLAAYAQHLKMLNIQDKFTRFGYAAGDYNIDQLILNMLYHPQDHHLFVALVDDDTIGFTHLAKCNHGWELAVSVSTSSQGRGIGNQLMAYAIDWARTHGVSSLFMHCIRNNQLIQHLAAKHGLHVIERSGADVTAQVNLSPATTTDYTVDFVREQQDLVDQMVELHQRWLANFNPITRRQRNDISNRTGSSSH